ncbi:hypothetical protein HAX54_049228 [Datura stramonium]|uniref:Uncharacterized protein n=1 Tax=Datura stramonium TaxID=4076 RepID=A0ABS8RR47_DATST|nr:hypothetical protein [Datura stramonium]
MSTKMMEVTRKTMPRRKGMDEPIALDQACFRSVVVYTLMVSCFLSYISCDLGCGAERHRLRLVLLVGCQGFARSSKAPGAGHVSSNFEA